MKHRKSRTKKLIDAVENTQPITEQALIASGIAAAGKPRKVRVKQNQRRRPERRHARSGRCSIIRSENSSPRSTFTIRLREGEKDNRMEYMSSQSERRKRIKFERDVKIH